MPSSDSDQIPDLVYSSDSDEEHSQLPEFTVYGGDWTKRLEEIVKIRTLALFIFMVQFDSDDWKSVLDEGGLLTEQMLNAEEKSIPTLLKRVELMEHFTDHMTTTLRSKHKRELACNLMEALLPMLMNKQVLLAASDHQLIRRVRSQLTKFPPDEDKDKVTLGLVYSCYQYVQVLKFLEISDYVRDFDNDILRHEKNAEKLKEEGTRHFDHKRYEEALTSYNNALQKSPFSHVLYALRSEVYLNKAECLLKAAIDAKRSIVLRNEYSKGYYLCAMACFKLKYTDRAKALRDKLVQLDEEGSLEAHSWLSKLYDDTGDLFRPENLAVHPNEPTRPRQTPTEATIKKSRELRAQSEPRHATRPVSCSPKHGQKKNKKKQEKTKQQKATKETPVREPSGLKKGIAKMSFTLPHKVSQDEHRDRLCRGSKCLLDGDFNNAILHYKYVFQCMLDNHMEGNLEFTLLQYSWGTALRKRGIHKDLREAVKKFEDLLKSSTIRPMSHLALGQTYYLQAKFHKSEEILKQGLILYQYQVTVMWPGTNQVIYESQASNLKKELDKMIISCHNPPPPVAKCRRPKSEKHDINIYLENPEFKGYVRVICSAKCLIEYHLECWKVILNEASKSVKKDLINTVCLTPDCNALIKSVIYYDSEGNEKRRVDDSKSQVTRLSVKQQRIPRRNRQKKCERNNDIWEKRKMIRKQRRRQAQERQRTSDRNDETSQYDAKSVSNSTEGATAKCAQDPKVFPLSGDVEKFATVIKKEDYAEDQNQITRRKKKKEKPKKTKVFLPLVDSEPEDDMFDWFSVHDGHQANFIKLSLNNEKSNLIHPWATLLEDSLQQFSGDSFQQNLAMNGTGSAVTESALMASMVTEKEATNEKNETKEFIYSYFHDILSHHGPLKVTSDIISQGLQQFPEEILEFINKAGGIGPFLSQNVQFEFTEDLLFLIEDWHKAMAMIQDQKKEMIEKYRLKLAQTLSSKTVKNKRMKKKRTSCLSQGYSYMDEECLSEQSWPESEFSQVSKKSQHSGFSSANKTVNKSAISLSYLPDFVNKAFSNGSLFTDQQNKMPGNVFTVGKTQSPQFSLNNLQTPLDNQFTPFQDPNIDGPMINGINTDHKENLIKQPVSSTEYYFGHESLPKGSDILEKMYFNNDNDDMDSASGSFSDISSVTGKQLMDTDQMDDGLEISSLSANVTIQSNVGDINLDGISRHVHKAVGKPLSAARRKKTRGKAMKNPISTEKIKDKLLVVTGIHRSMDDVLRSDSPQMSVDANKKQSTSGSDLKNNALGTCAREERYSRSNLYTSHASMTRPRTSHSPQANSQSSDSSLFNSANSVMVYSSAPSLNHKAELKNAATSTDMATFDWDEMEAVIKQLTEENARLSSNLEHEKQTQTDLKNEHRKQMDQLMMELTNKDLVIEGLIRSRKIEQEKHKEETAHLRRDISSQSLNKSRGKNHFMVFLSDIQNDDNHVKLLEVLQQEEMKKFEYWTQNYEKQLRDYEQIIEMCQVEKLQAPPEATANYKKLMALLMEMNEQQQNTKMFYSQRIKEIKQNQTMAVDLSKTHDLLTPKPFQPTDGVLPEDDDACPICFEELTPDTQLKNECGHCFHSSCIRKWLKMESTCPTCRKYIILEDEFPSLH